MRSETGLVRTIWTMYWSVNCLNLRDFSCCAAADRRTTCGPGGRCERTLARARTGFETAAGNCLHHAAYVRGPGFIVMWRCRVIRCCMGRVACSLCVMALRRRDARRTGWGQSSRACCERISRACPQANSSTVSRVRNGPSVNCHRAGTNRRGRFTPSCWGRGFFSRRASCVPRGDVEVGWFARRGASVEKSNQEEGRRPQAAAGED